MKWIYDLLSSLLASVASQTGIFFPFYALCKVFWLFGPAKRMLIELLLQSFISSRSTSNVQLVGISVKFCSLFEKPSLSNQSKHSFKAN